jgi:hypothetical protein
MLWNWCMWMTLTSDFFSHAFKASLRASFLPENTKPWAMLETTGREEIDGVLCWCLWVGRGEKNHTSHT